MREILIRRDKFIERIPTIETGHTIVIPPGEYADTVGATNKTASRCGVQKVAHVDLSEAAVGREFLQYCDNYSFQRALEFSPSINSEKGSAS